jgi:ABC-type multidrug transport system ATPase subunit
MPRPVLEVAGLTVTARDGTVLVDDANFAVEAGWLVGIVGPTGAGKSSLASAIAGHLPASAGHVQIRGRVAHVGQDDVLHSGLTLRRTLDHAAALRVDDRERGGRVDEVLDALDLGDRADLRVANLSGGQRRRASVAVELVADTDVLVLDEPTAGLDPAAERGVFAGLRRVADRGRTVIATTHGLTALGQCDRVVVLATGGRVAYFGTPEGASAHVDPGSAAGRARGVAARAAATAAAATTETTTPTRRSQLVTMMRRNLDLLRADRRNLAMVALTGPAVGLLLWLVIAPGSLRPPGPDDAIPTPRILTAALFLAVSATWLGTAGAVREIVKERALLRAERTAGVSVRAYVGGKFTVVGAVGAVQVIAMGALACSRLGLVSATAMVQVTAALMLSAVAAVALGLLVSALSRSNDKALTALPVVLITQLALAGPWPTIDRTPVLAQLRLLSTARWGVDAVAAVASGHNGAWSRAVAMLGVLTVVTVVGVLVAVRHGLEPWSRPSLPSISFLPDRVTWRRAALAPLGMLALVGGTLAVWGVPSGPVRQVPVSPALTEPPPESAELLTDEVALAPATTAPVAEAPKVEATPATTPTTRAPSVAKPATTTPPSVAPAPQPTPTTAAPRTTTTTRPPTTPTTVPAQSTNVMNPFTFWTRFMPFAR